MRRKNGFTIIEVALVLAIAGLIFLMVFVALPPLRRSQRDSERREKMLSLLSEIKDYQSNNRGALPKGAPTDGTAITAGVNSTGDDDTWAGFYKKYLGNNFRDPDGDEFQLAVMECTSEDGKTDLKTGENCQNNGLTGRNLPEATFPNDYQIKVVIKASCYGDVAQKNSNPRRVAVLYKLEGAGVYCADS